MTEAEIILGQIQPLPCCGTHAYESGPCKRIKPKQRYEDGDCERWCQWQIDHLHPCKCGSDSVDHSAAGELHCEDCDNCVCGNNYDLICAEWNRQNPPGNFHPYVS